MQQVAMRAVQLDHVKPRLISPLSCLRKGIDHSHDVVLAHLAGHWPTRPVSDGAGADHLPVRLPFDRLAAIEWAIAFPRTLGPGPATRVVQLNTDSSALLVEKVDDAAQRWHLCVLPQTQVADCSQSTAFHLTGLHEHQAGTAQSKLGEMRKVPVGGDSVDGGVLGHRGHHDPIFQGQAAQRERGMLIGFEN